MIETFHPIWNTASQKLATVVEGQTISIPLSVDEYLYTQGTENQFLLTIGAERAQRVISFKIGGQPAPYTVVDDDIRFAPLTGAASLEVWLLPDLTFSLLNGTLPVGLSVDQTSGRIHGTVGNITEIGTITHTFTIRAATSDKVRDRSFTIDAQGVDYAAFFNLESFPPITYDPQTFIPYRKLAELDRADALSYTLDIVDNDGGLPPISVKRATGLPQGFPIYGGLPPGLAIVGHHIQGVVSASADAGRYVFEIHIDDPTSPSSMMCMIEIRDQTDGEVQIVPQIMWQTPPGLLATMHSGEPAYMQVSAKVIATSEATYELAPASAPLPPGLSLNSVTGEIFGKVEDHLTDRSYSFVLRARSDELFVDQLMRIDVRAMYSSLLRHDLSLRMRVLERLEFVEGYKNVIPDSLLFRPDDSNYGLDLSCKVYLIHGLDGTGDLEAAVRGDNNPAVSTKDYHSRFSLVLGEHRSAVARDENGNVIYEVIFRELYDRQNGAGGFLNGFDTPIEDRVVWAQSPIGEPTKYVYPNSLRNIRYDLVKDIGFATTDQQKRYLIGPGSIEGKPLWMKSEQVLGDQSSVIDYTAAIVVAYVVPGASAEVLARLKRNATRLVNNGRMYMFDAYYLAKGITIPGTLFSDNTTFSDMTVFDGRTGSVVKYI